MIKRVHILCLCRSIKLPDMDLELHQGQETVVSEAAARRSHDLAAAQRCHAVRVSFVPVCDVLRDADSPRRKPLRMRATPIQQPPVHLPTVAPMDTTALAKEIKDRILAELLPALSRLPIGSLVSPVPVVQMKDEPVRFIPDGLVGKAVGSVAVKAGISDDDQVTKATEQLKRRKREKK